MTMAATEDRATRGRDPSADCGAETEGWAAHRRPSFQIPFGIGINAINPEAAQPPSPRASDALSSLKKRISVSTIRGERQIMLNRPSRLAFQKGSFRTRWGSLDVSVNTAMRRHTVDES
jgi:hypothetical protein